MKGINSFSIVLICIVLASCKADMICPAYQSYFLLDETAQRDQFAYFAQDSLPRRDVFHSTLDKNGLVAKTSLFAYVDPDWVRNRELRTVNMEVVYPVISDSLLFAGDVMMYAETDVVDSTALDSARLAAQTFRYGADQKYYNWYFRDKLVWKDELEGGKEPAPASTNLKENKGGFLKNLFKKKEKSPDQSTLSERQMEDGVDEEEVEKKGLFKKKEKQSKEKKSKKDKKETSPPDKSPSPTNKEDDNDGEDDF